ncbi:hypothetical protein D3C80_1622300 [compost metagenome]
MNSAIIMAPIINDNRFKPPTVAIAGMNPLPIALKCSSLTIIVPVFSVTRSNAPLKINIAAREATNEGIPICATKKPLNNPIIIPNTKMSGMVIYTGTPAWVNRIAAIAPRNPAANPTDRSMCRMTMTSVIPTANTAI